MNTNNERSTVSTFCTVGTLETFDASILAGSIYVMTLLITKAIPTSSAAVFSVEISVAHCNDLLCMF